MQIAERGRAEMRIVERGLRNGKTSLAYLFKVRSFQPSNFEYASLGCWPVDRDHSAIRVPHFNLSSPSYWFRSDPARREQIRCPEESSNQR
jgi:hypothetical protein